ncbi:unnamed protein product [Trichobilharzia szidati]|nr:unnamed protein product [Trichobilharzia szidati]
MEKYENLGLVGEGSYGMVIKCKNKETGRIVAIKKFIDSEDDKHVKKIALREIRMLKQLRHDNLVNLLEVFRRKKRLYLVFEFVDHTILDDLEKFPNGIEELRTKRILFQVIRGVEFCHLHNIVHRDIKPENILISRSGVVKLCDFGFARTLAAPGEVYTDYVATRWYRAPELLVGDTKYGRPIDIWAIGCLAAEMLTGDPLFPGDSDIDQLHRIVRCLGNLSEKYQNIFQRNPLFVGMRVPLAREIDPLDKRLAKVSKLTLGFIKICLRIDANDRPTSSALLRNEYFTRDNFSTVFLEELKNLIKNEAEQNTSSTSNYSSTNVTSDSNKNINNINNPIRNKNDSVNNNLSTSNNNNSNNSVNAMGTTSKLYSTDTSNTKKPNMEKLTEDVTLLQQVHQETTEINEKNKSQKSCIDNPSGNPNNLSKAQSDNNATKFLMVEHAKPNLDINSNLIQEYSVVDENVDPQHLIDSKDLYHGTNKVLDKNDDPDSKGAVLMSEKSNDRSNEMPSIPQKSFGLLTTIKCQSPKSVNSVTVPCTLEESREPLDEKTSATTLSLSPLQDNFVVNNEQSSGNSVNQPLFVGGFINKITEVNNEQSDCSSVLTKTCTRKPLDSKGEEPHSKDTTSNKLLPYLTSTQVSSHHIFPQHLRGFYQSPQKTLVSDDVNVHNSDNPSSGMNVSSLSPLMMNNQTNSKHDIRPVLQSSNFPASTSISFQSWMAQTSASNASNSSKDSKSRRYYQPPNHRRSTFSLQFPMNISHATSQPISTSLSNHYHHSHNHHFSVLHPIGVMPSPNMFDFNHEQSHFEQNDARSFNGHLYFSSRSPLQSLSQQNVFKKSLISTNTTSTSKQENTYSLTGNQHSISPQILPVVTCSAYSANQYGTNTKSNTNNTTSNHNQFPLSRLRNSDKFWLGSLPRR